MITANEMNKANMTTAEKNLWDVLKQYKSKWVVKEKRRFTEAELAAIDRAEVKAGPHGLSICFFMKNSNGYRFISVDSRADLGIGETPDPKDLVIKVLENVGDPNVPMGTTTIRVEYDPEESAESQVVDFNNPFGL